MYYPSSGPGPHSGIPVCATFKIDFVSIDGWIQKLLVAHDGVLAWSFQQGSGLESQVGGLGIQKAETVMVNYFACSCKY